MTETDENPLESLRKTRVKHSTLPAERVFSRIGRPHFSFFKSYLEGLDPVAMANRFFGSELHGNAVPSMVDRIRRDLIALARRKGKPSYARAIGIRPERLADTGTEMNIDQFRDELEHGDFYSEAELLELFTAEYPESNNGRKRERNIRIRKKQAEALSWLETQTKVDPVPADALTTWLMPNLARHLSAAGIRTIAELVHFVNVRGRRWFSKVPNVGEKTGNRILKWLLENKDLLGVEIGKHALLSYRSLPESARVIDRKEFGIVPMEFFKPLDALDGSMGLNRGQNNKTSATNDYQAIEAWLNTVKHNKNTYRSYRREAERFLLWSLLERGKPMSSMTIEDCTAYRDFLYDLGRLPDKVWADKYRIPQPDWLGKRATPRWSPAWRPFEMPPILPPSQKSLLEGTAHEVIYLKPVLAPYSQRQAQTILMTMCEWLTKVKYLDSNPWVGVPARQKQPQKIRVDRSFTESEWAVILDYLERSPETPRYIRLRFIMKLAYGTGLRLSEMTSPVFSDLKRYDLPKRTRWMVRVIGKGMKERLVPVPSSVIEEFRRYLASRGYAYINEVPLDAPLIDRLADASTDDEAGDAPGISNDRLYQIVKAFFAEVANSIDKEDRDLARKIRNGSTHWLRHTNGSHSVQRGTPLHVVRDNFGHVSLSTTSIYVTSDIEERMDEAEKMGT